jgi:hypothetical protein
MLEDVLVELQNILNNEERSEGCPSPTRLPRSGYSALQLIESSQRNGRGRNDNNDDKKDKQPVTQEDFKPSAKKKPLSVRLGNVLFTEGLGAPQERLNFRSLQEVLR